MKKRFSKSFIITLAILIPLVLLAQNSGPQNYATVIMTFLRAQTAAAARSAIGAASSGSGGALTNAVIYGSTSGNVTFGSTASFIGTGTANGLNVTTPVSELHVGSTSTSSPRGIMSAQYTTDALGARLHMRKARGTEASPAIVSTGDDLGRIMWSGYDGASYLEMASIRAAATGTVTNPNRLPTQLIFSTATDASPSVLTDRMWLNSSGYLGLGINAPTEQFMSVGSGGVGGIVIKGRVSTYLANSISFTANESTGQSIITAYGPDTSTRGTFSMYVARSNNGSGIAALNIDNAGAIGIGTTVPGSFGLAVNHATGQGIQICYNAPTGSPSNYANLTVGATGNLTIAPSGGTTAITGAITSTGSIIAGTTLTSGSANAHSWSSRSVIRSPSDGVISLANNAEADFGRLQFGGTTSSFPAIKRSSTTLAFRLADDSADAPISASNGTFSGYVVGGVQSLSGAGAVNVTQAITEVTTTGAGDALTLANGVAGQEKTIIHGVDGGSFVLTPTTKTGWSTFTSTVAGESITLVYLTTRGWIVKGSYLGAIAP